MDIRNSPPRESSASPLASAADVTIFGLEKLGRATTMVVGGKTLKVQENVNVRGSESRDVSKLTPVYRDAVGRLTTEPVGKAEVGYILKGGTNNRLCFVGLLP